MVTRTHDPWSGLAGEASPFVPPHPRPLSPVGGLLRMLWRGDGNLLDLLPRAAYEAPIGPLGTSRRGTVIVNRPDLVREVLMDTDGLFPKSDLMVHALEPLIGASIFVSTGSLWQRQRAMLDPALSLMRVHRAYPAMAAGVAAAEEELEALAASGAPFTLDLFASHLTADIICRTVFSTTLSAGSAHRVFAAFTTFERAIAQVKIRRLILDPAFAKPPQDPAVLEACRVIRAEIGALIDGHRAGPARFDDIASEIIAARDSEGRGFTREELIDQLGVLFLAGHETSASALTWALHLLAVRPELMARARAEVAAVVGEEPITFDATRRMPFLRAFFREVLRLYPPITFLPRVAMADTSLDGFPIRRGNIVMVSPWTLHRHRRYWEAPNSFDPERFLGDREARQVPGAYLPFGTGPRVCAGAAFATVEATLILASLVRRFDLAVEAPETVRPAARLTTRPVVPIRARVRRVRA